MFLNGMLKSIENCSLGSRGAISLHSKCKSFAWIPILLQKEVGVFKNENASFEFFREYI